MKYSYNWLKEISKTQKTPQQLADLITRRAFEFEDLREVSGGFQNIVVGKIESIKKHPNADRLQLTKISIGGKKLNIVCGALNIKVGNLVPVALPGAVLGKDFVIKETEIRGAKSQGMLCSKKELGLGNDHEGIFILEKNAKIGQKFSEYLEAGDIQLEFAILPNRGHDALSHIGMAREICTCEDRKFILTFNIRALLKSNSGKLKIDIQDKNLCPRYVGAKIENIEISAAPIWMQNRLSACGVKPINNIVDITNYVMLETGQPLHAFDLQKIESEFPISNFQLPNKSQNLKSKIQISIRKAKKGEGIKLLDEKVYKLNESDLVIADSRKPLALAGVMGGFDSAIDENTASIILEAANFNSTSIRKTRMRHYLNTDSSYRFERQIDPNFAAIGAARAIELIKKYGGKNVKISAISDIYPKKVKSWKIKLDIDYVNRLLGEKIPVLKMKNVLDNLGIIAKNSGKNIICTIPTRRIDLKSQEDLIEEIGRVYGYENIKEQAPLVEVKTTPQNKKRNFENNLRDILIGLGFSEVLNYSFYGADDIKKCDLRIESHIEIANPLSLDQQYLRRNLVTNILKNIHLNLKNFPKVQIFEIGKKFCNENGKFNEIPLLVGAMSCKNSKELLFFEMKGKIEAVFEKIDAERVEFRALKEEYKFWHPSRSAQIVVDGKKIGRIGEIKPQVLKNYGIKQRVAVFGMKIEDILKISSQERQYEPVSKFPVVERDLSMFIGKEAIYADIKKEIYEAGGKLVVGVEHFDIFEKEGEKSLALRLKIGSDEKTLTSEEIEAVMKKIIAALEKDLRVKIRK